MFVFVSNWELSCACPLFIDSLFCLPICKTDYSLQLQEFVLGSQASHFQFCFFFFTAQRGNFHKANQFYHFFCPFCTIWSMLRQAVVAATVHLTSGGGYVTFQNHKTTRLRVGCIVLTLIWLYDGAMYHMRICYMVMFEAYSEWGQSVLSLPFSILWAPKKL